MPQPPFLQTRRGAGVLLLILALSFVLAACEKEQQQQKAATPPPAQEVATITIAPQEVMLTTELPGRTSAHLVAEIRPQVTGIIKERLFEEGSDVKAGDLLYQIDPAPFQATYNNQKAGLAKAKAVLATTEAKAERYKSLLAAKTISQQDYDDVVASLGQAKAEVDYWVALVEKAHIDLAYTRVTAPISGRIGKSSVTVGALATAYQQQALTTIQQLDPIYVDVPQSSSELLRLERKLKNGSMQTSESQRTSVKLLLEDGTPYAQEGTFQFRDVTVDTTTGSVSLRIVFPNPEQMLLPGMFVRAVIQEGFVKEAMLIPQQAVSRDPKGNPLALTLDQDGAVRQHMLTLDRAIDDHWLVASGLNWGDQLIVEGLQKVRAGSKAKAVPFEEQAPAQPAASADAAQANEGN